MGSNLSDSVVKVYQAARDGTADLNDILSRLRTDKRETALETKTKDGELITTPLIIAARNGNLDSVKILLRYNADIEARGTLKFTNDEVIDGCTPLWAAAATGHLDVVELLIERNAEVDGRTLKGSTPLRAVAYGGRLDIVSCLVEHGADVNARDYFGSTPLMITCYNGHMNVATYLVENGANIHLQDKNGDTCLHFAAERGHVALVSKLLALGVKENRNYKRLTPLLAASNYCKIEIVEYFINRPECTKEQRIDALELLGATLANDPDFYDIRRAFSYMKRGMEERYEDPSHPLLKKKMEPVEAYQNRKESQTLEELALLEGDDHAIHMEGLIIRERILGTDNTVLLYEIRYRGTVFANSEQYELYIGLWNRAMEIAMNCHDPVTEELEVLAWLSGTMAQKWPLSKPKCIEVVFEKLVAANEKMTETFKSTKLQEEDAKEEQEKMLYCALYLLIIYTKVQVPDENETADMTDFVQRFLRLNPRTRDGNTLLHLSVSHDTPFDKANVRSVYMLPCIETMKLILHAGCDVNVINSEGNTPLHLAVSFKPRPGQVEILKYMLELLLDKGADAKLVNTNGQTAVDRCETDEARRILSEKRALDAMNVDSRAVRKF